MAVQHQGFLAAILGPIEPLDEAAAQRHASVLSHFISGAIL
jgi:hypothetical protein